MNYNDLDYEFLQKISDEIENLKLEIIKQKNKNTKIKMLKILHSFLCTLRFVLPYVTTISILLMTSNFFNYMPFKLDEHKKYSKIMHSYDSYGNEIYEEQYNDFRLEKDKIVHYDKWVKVDDYYTRDIKVYKINDVNEEYVFSLLENEVENLESIFGKPIDIRKERRKNIDLNELNANGYLEAIFYSSDYDKYITYYETIGENFFGTGLFILLSIITNFSVARISKFDYKYEMSRIKDRYSSNEYNKLKKKLKILEDNYERLMR